MWFLLALAAATLWGLAYAIHGQVYKQVSVLTALTISSFVTTVFLSIWALVSGRLAQDYAAITSSKYLTGLIVAEAVVSMLAAMVVGLSIQQRNATVAGIVEMSYPLFIVLFSYFLFRENSLTLPIAIGGLFIFAGVATIYLSSN